MPEHLRALAFLLILASATFYFVQRIAPVYWEMTDFKRRRNIWLMITIAAFLSHNFWIYSFLAAMTLILASKREDNLVALYFFVLFAAPPVPANIPGFGIINFLFAIDHLRLLSLTLLLPAFLKLSATNRQSFGKTLPDKVLLAYLLLQVALALRGAGITEAFREYLYLFLDIFLPYYVVSRSLSQRKTLHEAMFGFVLAGLILASIGFFEFARHWLLYNPLVYVGWGLDWNFVGYLGRADALRAGASTGNIPLGYVMAVAIGFYLYLSNSLPKRSHQRLIGAWLGAGLFAPLSRGPWVGAAVVLVTYLSTGRNAIKRLAMLVMATAISLPLIAVMPGGEKIINLLPYIGTTEKENIDYRERLFETSMIVIKRNLLLGSDDYMQTEEMESMRQGQGIIDVVNSYIGEALERGILGLGLFAGFFLSVLWGIYKSMRSIGNKDDDLYKMGQALLASLVGILTIIATVSSITVIPVVYWSVAGLGVAYMQIVKNRGKELQPAPR